MKIVAKSGCKLEQLEDRYNKGFRFFEIQLDREFVDETFSLANYNHIMSNCWDIQSIHMPIVPDGEEFNLEYLGDSKYSMILFNVCKIAQACADFYKHPIIIVIHDGIPIKSLIKMPDTLNKIVSIFEIVFKYYPSVIFSIENITSFVIKNKTVKFRQNCFTENVEIAQYLNKRLDTNRFGTTLDICHVLMTQLSMQFISDYPKWEDTKRDLEYYIAENQNTINNVHLNNMREIGIQKMNHGASFDKDNPSDMLILDNFFDLYQKYEYSCNVTLEVDEISYLDAINAKRLKDLIEERYLIVQKDR